MDKMLKQLISILQKQSDILNKMINLASDKTNLLVNTSTDGINEIVQAEQDLSFAMDMSEKELDELIKQISLKLDLGNERVKISQIIKMAEDPLMGELKFLKDNISLQLKNYKEISRLNYDLIKNNLNYVEYMINSITGRQEYPVTYGTKGYTQKEEGSKRFFDNKA